MNKELIIVLDFGGQYNQLIARRVRECGVYAEIHPYTEDVDTIAALAPKGIIFTGGPNSVFDPKSPHYSREIFKLGIPIWASATAPSLWHTSWTAKLRPPRSANTAIPR